MLEAGGWKLELVGISWDHKSGLIGVVKWAQGQGW